MGINFKNLNLRTVRLAFGLCVFIPKLTFALTPFLPLANRCEYLFGGSHPIESISLDRPATKSQLPEIWMQLSPEQRSGVQRIIQNLKNGSKREPNSKTRESLQYYLRFLSWSLNNNAAEFKDPTHVLQARDMYLRLRRAEKEFLLSGRSMDSTWLDFVTKTLRGLRVLAYLKDGPTYENLAQAANDFSLAVSQFYSGPIDVTYKASIEHSTRTPILADKLTSNHRKLLEQTVSIAPIAYLRHFNSLSLQDFTDSFFFPELKIGILDQPITFDGRTVMGDDGKPVNAYANPAYFYEHDLLNHGSKMIPKEFLRPAQNKHESGFLVLTSDNVMRFFHRLHQQYSFHLYLLDKKSTLSPAHRDAIDAILMYIYHEAPDQFFPIAPEFTLQGLQKVLLQNSTDFRFSINDRGSQGIC